MNKKRFYRDLVTGKFANMVKENTRGETIRTSKEVFNTMKPLMAAEPDVEQFWVIFMDTKTKILDITKMFTGTIGNAAVYPREIVKKIIATQATGIVCSHNHPSGDPAPSKEDVMITKLISIATDVIGASMHDHVIVGANSDAGSLAGIQTRR